jgi:hypothetical protein
VPVDVLLRRICSGSGCEAAEHRRQYPVIAKDNALHVSIYYFHEFCKIFESDGLTSLFRFYQQSEYPKALRHMNNGDTFR